MRSGTCRRLKIEPTYSTRGSLDREAEAGRSNRRRGDAWRDDVDRSAREREAFDELALGELRDRDRPPGPRAAARRVSQRRRSPSRAVNHSGWATNDTSWIATTSRDVREERRGVGRREEDVEVIARDAAGSCYLLPPGAAGAGDDARGKPARVERERRAARARRGRTRGGGRAIVGGPLVQQPAK